MTDPLLVLRSEFPILERTTYLASNTLGAMPRSVPDRLAEYVDTWAERGVRAWQEGWGELGTRVADEIAPLIGASSGEIVMVPNDTLAQSTVISAVPYTPQRNRIVMTELDFPSVRYAHEMLATRFGAEIVVVPSHDGITVERAELLAAIDERTALVAISEVSYRSAFVHDVGAIVAHAHGVGALVCADSFHAVGAIPVDVKATHVDFLTGGVLKWLCGGPGGCFLYVAPAVRNALAPALTGWLAHARPFSFEDDMAYAHGISRWLGGTPDIPALYAAIEGPRLVRKAGVDAIRAKSKRQTAQLVAMATERGFALSTPLHPEQRAGTVSIAVPHAFEISRYLTDRDIIVDYRPKAGIRVAPHFYTTDEELSVCVTAMDTALATGDWQRYTAA